MKRYKSNEEVSYGVYASFNGMDIKFVSADGEALGGKDGANYIKIPTALLIAAAPLIGGAFVLSFPFIIILMVCTIPLYYFARSITLSAGKASEVVFKNVGQFTWEPMTAYFNKKKSKNIQSGKNKKTPEELADLENKVNIRRNDTK